MAGGLGAEVPIVGTVSVRVTDQLTQVPEPPRKQKIRPTGYRPGHGGKAPPPRDDHGQCLRQVPELDNLRPAALPQCALGASTDSALYG
jgi:hypothetical protein